MNSDFPMIISMLRRERRLSQKQVAADLGISQALLSHYMIAAFVTTFWSEKAMSFIVIPALVIGLGFILYAQFKYNKGIF